MERQLRSLIFRKESCTRKRFFFFTQRNSAAVQVINLSKKPLLFELRALLCELLLPRRLHDGCKCDADQPAGRSVRNDLRNGARRLGQNLEAQSIRSCDGLLGQRPDSNSPNSCLPHYAFDKVRLLFLRWEEKPANNNRLLASYSWRSCRQFEAVSRKPD